MTVVKEDNRYEFVESMLDQIHSLPIEKIILPNTEGITKRSGRHILCLCPFHKDTRLGSFIITPSLGLWKCFSCGEGYGGDAVKFISLYHNISYLDAAFQIARDHGMISESDNKRYGKKIYSSAYVKNLECSHRSKGNPVRKPSKASAEICHNVYSLIQKECSLSAEHLECLRSTRHLSDTRIEKDYFTFPVHYKVKAAIIQKIHDTFGYTDDVLKTVPGFFFDRDKKQISFMGYRGIGILIRNHLGMVQAIQIRKDSPKKNESRYIWFSSSFAFYDPEHFDGGSGCGSPIDVCIPENTCKGCLCITEGRFKSEILLSHQNISLSLQGVSSWKGIVESIQAVREKHRLKRVCIFLDADILGKHMLFLQSHKMAVSIHESFPYLDIRYFFWKKEYGKGIDDCENNHNLEKIHSFSIAYAWLTVTGCFKELCEHYQIKSLSDLPSSKSDEFEDTLQNLCEKKLSL